MTDRMVPFLPLLLLLLGCLVATFDQWNEVCPAFDSVGEFRLMSFVAAYVAVLAAIGLMPLIYTYFPGKWPMRLAWVDLCLVLLLATAFYVSKPHGFYYGGISRLRVLGGVEQFKEAAQDLRVTGIQWEGQRLGDLPEDLRMQVPAVILALGLDTKVYQDAKGSLFIVLAPPWSRYPSCAYEVRSATRDRTLDQRIEGQTWVIDEDLLFHRG